jgi:hypothetical protein
MNACLQRLADANLPRHDTEVIVVNNGAAIRAEAEALRKHFEGCLTLAILNQAHS